MQHIPPGNRTKTLAAVGVSTTVGLGALAAVMHSPLFPILVVLVCVITVIGVGSIAFITIKAIAGSDPERTCYERFSETIGLLLDRTTAGRPPLYRKR